jgi:hypothetical protein
MRRGRRLDEFSSVRDSVPVAGQRATRRLQGRAREEAEVATHAGLDRVAGSAIRVQAIRNATNWFSKRRLEG